MSRYKVGDEILIKGKVIGDIDSDGEYYVRILYGEKDDFGWEDMYFEPKYIVGKVDEYTRTAKYAVGDVLQDGCNKCVISYMGDEQCIVTFKDGSGGYRSFKDLDRHFTHTGENISDELYAVLDILGNPTVQH